MGARDPGCKRLHLVVASRGACPCGYSSFEEAGCNPQSCRRQECGGARDPGCKRLHLVETAPNDGSWGAAMNSSAFLSLANPADFTLGIVVEDTFRFETKDGKL